MRNRCIIKSDAHWNMYMIKLDCETGIDDYKYGVGIEHTIDDIIFQINGAIANLKLLY